MRGGPRRDHDRRVAKRRFSPNADAITARGRGGISLAVTAAMHALLLAIASTVLVPALASAEDGPPVSGGLEYTFGHGGRVEDLELGTRLESGFFVRVGRWQATLAIPVNPEIKSSNVDRDTATLVGFGVGGRIAYRAPLFGGVLTLASGLTRRYATGEHDVMRTCGQTRECIAGTYVETPSYSAWAPQLRIGIGADKILPTMVMAISADLIVEAIGFNDVPPNGIRNVAIAGGITFTVGWGPHR
jgi:hypothetical protein